MKGRRKSRGAAVCVALAGLLLVAGCQADRWGSGREEVEVGGKKITVMDNPEQVAYDATEVDELLRLDGVRGNDWLADDRIIVSRENVGMEPTEAEGVIRYPVNLYARELSTGIETAIAPGTENQDFAMVSPDRTKIFYKTMSLQSATGQGHIYDIAEKTSETFTEEDAIAIDNGRWNGNDSLVYSTIDGAIYELDTDSMAYAMLQNTGEMFPGNLAKIGGRTYYTTKGDLHILTEDRGMMSVALANVIWMVPSPDGRRLAIVTRTRGGEMELLMTGPYGGNPLALARDSQIYGMSWSPDGSKLAYAGITSNGTVRGIYVADAATGTSSAQSLDVKFISDPLRWNPSGNRLMVTTTVPDDKQARNRFVTYLLRVR